jgi:hypothetical protein
MGNVEVFGLALVVGLELSPDGVDAVQDVAAGRLGLAIAALVVERRLGGVRRGGVAAGAGTA